MHTSMFMPSLTQSLSKVNKMSKKNENSILVYFTVEPRLCGCLSVASHISETNEAIGITFDSDCLSPDNISYIKKKFTFSEVRWTHTHGHGLCSTVKFAKKSTAPV